MNINPPITSTYLKALCSCRGRNPPLQIRRDVAGALVNPVGDNRTPFLAPPFSLLSMGRKEMKKEGEMGCGRREKEKGKNEEREIGGDRHRVGKIEERRALIDGCNL